MTQMPVPITGYADCEWPLDPGCLGDPWDALETPIQEWAQALAGATLRRLTGYRVGGCPVTVRPCRQGCVTPLYGFATNYHPHLNEQSHWVNACGCSYDCSCGPVEFLRLPLPVGAVYEVTLGGDIFTDWYLAGSMLARVDGDLWPICQDMDAPLTEANTFSVTYLQSWPVDKMGERAAGTLAVEFAKACSGQKCRLPLNVTSVVRQGVSFEIEGGAFPNGFTGIREVDSYIALWNPDGLRQASTVWTPGSVMQTERG